MAIVWRRKLFFGGILTILLLLGATAYADTATSDYNMFKRSTSPAYLWGGNGVLTIPKAQPVGKYNTYLAAYGQEAGTIQGDTLYYSRATLMIGTSDDVELGFTKAQLIWDNGEKTDVEADVYSCKARVLNLGEYWLPSVAIGAHGTSLQGNRFNSEKDLLFNPYITATIKVPLFHENVIFSGTIDSEWLHNNGESTKDFINIGVDISILDDFLIVAAEQLGVNDEELEPTFNVAAKLKLLKVIHIGLGQYNLGEKNDRDAYFVGFIGISMPFGDWAKEN